jgi:hypothetical protein
MYSGTQLLARKRIESHGMIDNCAHFLATSGSPCIAVDIKIIWSYKKYGRNAPRVVGFRIEENPNRGKPDG